MDLITIIFIGYLFFLLLVGLRTFKFNKTQEDYLLAGRRLGPWITAFSERASGESAWMFLAFPGAAILIGLGEFWTVIGLILGIIASWFLIAEKLRIQTEKYNVLTIPDFLHKKYNDSTGIIRLFSSIIISFFYTFYVSAQFHASGKILNSLFNLDPISGITIGAAVIIFYTLLGGFFAVAWTDFFQGILMIGTLVIVPVVGFIELSNFEKNIFESLKSAELVFQNGNSSFFKGEIGFIALMVALNGLSWGLGYLGQPHLLIRYMAIKNASDINFSRKIAILMAIPSVIGAFSIGLIAVSHPDFGPMFFQNVDPEQAMPLLAKKLLHPILAGLFISGAVAAMMSTADSQLLVSTSAVSEDMGLKFSKIKKDLNEVTNSRIITMLLGLIAYGIAIFSQITSKTIFGVVSYAWSVLGSAFGPALVMTLWWKKTTREGVIAGLFVGFLTTIIWANFSELRQVLTERLSSFFLSSLAVFLVSKYYKRS